MKKFMLFVFMAVFLIVGNLGLSYGADYDFTFSTLDPQLIAGDIATAGEPPIEDQAYTFEITNVSGQTWTDFHLQVALGSAGNIGAAWIDDYTGPGNETFSRFNASLASISKFDLVDIVGLNIPNTQKYNFQLNISAGESGWQLQANPTVGGPVQPPNGVPEPGTLLLLGSGLIGLVGLGRKKFLQN